MVTIKLPKASDEMPVAQFLRQLELAVHHAKKSYEALREEADLSGEEIEYYVTYRFPSLNLYEREMDDEGKVKVHVDEEGELVPEIEFFTL
jgi:hypothetical protein